MITDSRVVVFPDYVCVLDLGMFELSLLTSDGSEQVLIKKYLPLFTLGNKCSPKASGIIQIEHNIVKNPNWLEANQFVYKKSKQKRLDVFHVAEFFH